MIFTAWKMNGIFNPLLLIISQKTFMNSFFLRFQIQLFYEIHKLECKWPQILHK